MRQELRAVKPAEVNVGPESEAIISIYKQVRQAYLKGMLAACEEIKRTRRPDCVEEIARRKLEELNGK
jgi:hypothetical protein